MGLWVCVGFSILHCGGMTVLIYFPDEKELLIFNCNNWNFSQFEIWRLRNLPKTKPIFLDVWLLGFSLSPLLLPSDCTNPFLWGNWVRGLDQEDHCQVKYKWNGEYLPRSKSKCFGYKPGMQDAFGCNTYVQTFAVLHNSIYLLPLALELSE